MICADEDQLQSLHETADKAHDCLSVAHGGRVAALCEPFHVARHDTLLEWWEAGKELLSAWLEE